jgi:CheY-like chemotaxis protein
LAETSPRAVRVLYVEDNALVREITCELLARDDREVRACESAEDALREFEMQPFDILITDISLPSMSGIDLAKAIIRLQPDLRVILASGYAVDLGLEKLGSNWRSITKPFDSAQIDALIGDCRIQDPAAAGL